LHGGDVTRKFRAFSGSGRGSRVAGDQGTEATMRPLSYESYGLEAVEQNGPHLLFAEHHRSLHRAGEALMARAREDDCDSVVPEFRTFEKQVLDHMRAEEDIILPAFADASPTEAADIRNAHATIRKQLERTALDVELHAIRVEAIRNLLAMLDDHAKYEDRTMYPWAQIHLPLKSRSALGGRILASIRKLAEIAYR
jgi:hemerythrin superfamily protein